MFVDIEFNRKGDKPKEAKIHGVEKIVRPDIIIHNRKTGTDKVNLLVVECKKAGAADEEIQRDRDKIQALMQQEGYQYSYGLQVIYGKDDIEGVLFFKSDTGIGSEAVSPT
jgi:hypothetical protein